MSMLDLSKRKCAVKQCHEMVRPYMHVKPIGYVCARHFLAACSVAEKRKKQEPPHA